MGGRGRWGVDRGWAGGVSERSRSEPIGSRPPQKSGHRDSPRDTLQRRGGEAGVAPSLPSFRVPTAATVL